MLGGAKNIVNSVKQCFFDILFPKYCIGCGKEGADWCLLCQKKNILAWDQGCFKCHASKCELGLCSTCQQLYFFDALVLAADYEDKIIGDLVKAYKYHFIKDLAVNLAWLLVERLSKEVASSKNLFFQDFTQTVVMAVPLSKRRQKWRGFNQAEEMAKIMASHFNLTYSDKLKRVKHRRAQAKLSEQERLNNLAGCFSFNGAAPEKVILVDDVVTTGATVNECAKALRAAGAEEILVLALAKG